LDAHAAAGGQQARSSLYDELGVSCKTTPYVTHAMYHMASGILSLLSHAVCHMSITSITRSLSHVYHIYHTQSVTCLSHLSHAIYHMSVISITRNLSHVCHIYHAQYITCLSHLSHAMYHMSATSITRSLSCGMARVTTTRPGLFLEHGGNLYISHS
jgi:hypothetical protein